MNLAFDARRIVMTAALAVAAAAPAAAQDLAKDPRVSQALTFLEMWLDGQRAYETIPGVDVDAEGRVLHLWRWNNAFPKVSTR